MYLQINILFLLIDLSRIMDKHLKSLAPKHMDTKFIKLDAEVCFLLTLLFLHRVELGKIRSHC